jgi:phage/plasmid-associated DNA primase
LKADGRFIEPEECTEALNKYRRETDHVLEFANEDLRILDAEDGGTPLREIFNAYKDWCKEAMFQPPGRNNFFTDLERVTGRKRQQDRHGSTGAFYIPGVYIA